MRSFCLNSPEAYEALCPRADRPWIVAGSLPREAPWGERSDPVRVAAEYGGDADSAVRAWLRHVEAGRIG